MNTENAGTIFKDSFSEEIWRTTYKDHKENDVNDTFRRVAKSIASAEETPELQQYWEDKFYALLTNFKGVSGGRITSNAGTDWNGTTFMNCFVGGLPDYNIDSIEGIYKVLQDQAKTLKSEGGWGMDFSWIRPRGSFIAGIGVESPGAVRFMELFDKSSEIVTAGSGKKKNNQKAKEKIRKGAQMATMACFAGTTWIDTIDGKVQIKDLVGTNPYLYCTDGNGNVFVRQALAVFSNGVRKTIKLHFDNGEYVECTPEHEFMLTDGSYVQAQNLKFSDSLAAINLRLQNDYLFVGVAGSRKQTAVHNAVYEMRYGSYPSSLGSGMTRTGDMTIAHHVDHDTINNHPDNILSMTVADHSRHHNSDNLDIHRERIAAERKGKTWDEYYGEEKATEIRTKRANTTKGKTPWNKGLSGEEYKHFYKEGFSNQFVENANHKVLKITESIEQEVFDISMPDYHNFCANGVFVHNCWHPDIIEFITAKQTGNKLSKFNMSVNCTADFMQKVNAVEQGDVSQDSWDLVFPDTTDENYKKDWKGSISDWKKQGGKVITYNTIKVSWLWNLIMESTYNRNEPGVLFLDRANERAPSNYLETILSTNPCGEQVLPPGGVCCLGTINLTQFINKEGTGFDLEKLAEYVKVLVRFLDNVNTISDAPLPEYVDSMRNKRRIGAGVMGWGSALLMLRVRFGSEKAEELREKVMQTYARTAYMTSIDLAIEKGMFKYCIPKKHAGSEFVKSLNLPEEYMQKLRTTGIRNSSLLSQQPNGNGSIFANVVTGGIEPAFMTEYIRTVIVPVTPDHMIDVTPKFYAGEFFETEMFKFAQEGDEQILKGVDKFGVTYKIDKNRGLTKEVLCEDYGIRYLKEQGDYDPNADYIVTTTELTVDDHVSDLKGFAKYTDSACSKTCNIPFDYPYEDFKNLYLQVYNSGVIKGFTTYRAGTMTSVLSAAKETVNAEEEVILEDIKLPDSLPASLKTLRAEGRKWYLTVIMNELQTKPVALFVQTNHSEKNVLAENTVDVLLNLARSKGIPEKHVEDTVNKSVHDSNATKVCRMISLCLRHGVLIRNIVSELDKVDCIAGTFVFHVRKYLASFIKDGEKVSDEKCQSCGSMNVVYQEGCKVCANCGSSKCG